MRDVDRWRRRLGLVGGIFLGGVLLVAAWAKALDPLTFAEQVRGEGLEFLLSAEVLAILLIAVEVGLGLALVLGIRRPWVWAPTAALVAFFVFLGARAYWRFSRGLIDESEACGCFGNLLARSPAEAFWQDLLLLVPALALVIWGRTRGPDWPRRRLAAVAVGVAGATVFAWKAPELPLDDLATRLRPGVELGGLCAGASGEDGERVCLDALYPELESGSHLVLISGLDAPELEAAIDGLNRLAVDEDAPALWLLTPAGEEERRAFFWRWGPAFEIRETPAELLRPLYRQLPRSFLVEDGTVRATFSGLPPLGAAAEPGGPAASGLR